MKFSFELVVAALIVISATFALIGSFGLVKLPDLMTRLHAPTKITTLGVGGALLASVIYFTFVVEETSVRELLIVLFLFLTAPISAHFLAKAYRYQVMGQDDVLPEPELKNSGGEGEKEG
ncbi:MAG: Na+/H+ antiporter subunit G [Azovibrio sp.]